MKYDISKSFLLLREYEHKEREYKKKILFENDKQKQLKDFGIHFNM